MYRGSGMKVEELYVCVCVRGLDWVVGLGIYLGGAVGDGMARK